ncbi:MAG: regulatory protein RecX [Zoogloeaceae bacterium]|nr:regulatory protein RecX [Zoogloeaceae bacterium]
MALSLRDRALRYLAQREHGRQDLKRKLGRHGGPEEVEALVAELAARDLVSDRRYAEGLVRTRAPRQGDRALRQTLVRAGVAVETIEATLEESERPDELARARQIWTRKFGREPQDRREWARQARFLQYRGFPTEIIRQVLKDCHDEPA